MTIPFLSLFKRDKADASKAKVRAATPAPPPLEKPSSERFSKTVMPNSTRTVAPQQRPSHARAQTAAAPIAPQQKAPEAARTISFASTNSAPAALPPAVALALEPRVERVISLEVADVIAQIPPGYCKADAMNGGARRILLKAAEVERGMASGRPAISLSTVYQQVPEIFEQPVAPDDKTQVALPFAKVLEQFAALQVRSDQIRHQAVPQVETPFLKVTLEDGERFGTPTPEIETGDLPPVRVEPPTAQAFAAAEPEAAAAEAFRNSAPAGAPQKTSGAPTPTRIPFKLSPNGTDVPANESVPASGGPSVPSEAPPAATAPTRIPFKISAPSEDIRPKPEPWLTAAMPEFAAETQTASAAGAEKKGPAISLPLRTVLQNLSPLQLTGDPNSVPEDVRFEVPFSAVESQLASGRVSIDAKTFAASIPVNFRSIFNAESAVTDVPLPLQAVLMNMPGAALRMRDDQIEQEVGSNFVTPFSAKADEDAKRFNVTNAPIAKPVIPAEAQTERPTPNAVGGIRTPLQVALDTDEKLDAKGVVAHLNKLPGVKACAIVFGDGLSLAGSLPKELEADGLCAMAPSLFQRIGNHIVETKLGVCRDVTLSCAKAAVTFFMHDNLCLAALHANGDLTSEAREKLGRVVHELSRKYSHPV